MLRWLATLVAVACALALASCRAADSSTDGRDDTVVLGWTQIKPRHVQLPLGDPIPTTGATLSTTDGVVLVNIWASYCVPCKKELPLLQSVSAAGTTVVGISRDARASFAEDSLQTAGVTYPNYLDSAADLMVALDGAIPMNQVPSSVILVDGDAVAVHVGPFETADDIATGLRLARTTS